MDTWNQRLESALTHRNVRPAHLAKAIGLSRASISAWLSGATRDIKGEDAAKVCDFLKIQLDWLLFGKGPRDRDSSASAAPYMVNEAPPRDFSATAGLGAAIQTPLRPVRTISHPDQIEHDIIQVPRYTLRASAGAGQPVLDIDERGTPNYCRREWATRNGYHPDKLFSIVAAGDSMVPTITDGASIIVLRTEAIANGRVHVICRDGECFVKRLFKQFDGSLLVKSDNEKNYRDIVIAADDELGFYIVGMVVSVTNNL